MIAEFVVFDKNGNEIDWYDPVIDLNELDDPGGAPRGQRLRGVRGEGSRGRALRDPREGGGPPMTEHAYDPDLPYVVVTDGNEKAARFRLRDDADTWIDNQESYHFRVIDTTPKPRVPKDATFITWVAGNLAPSRWFATRVQAGWEADNGTLCDHLEDLPGVTLDTVFTVLDERKS